LRLTVQGAILPSYQFARGTRTQHLHQRFGLTMILSTMIRFLHWTVLFHVALILQTM